METTNAATAPPAPQLVTFRPLREAGITAVTTSRDQRVLAALSKAGFELGRDAAPERFSLAVRDPDEQFRAVVKAARALRDLDVVVTVRNGIDFSAQPSRNTPLQVSPAPARSVGSPVQAPVPQRPARPAGRR